MKKNDILNILNEKKFKAKINHVENGYVVYRGEVINKSNKIPVIQPLFFHIPFSDIKKKMNNEVYIEDIIDWLA